MLEEPTEGDGGWSFWLKEFAAVMDGTTQHFGVTLAFVAKQSNGLTAADGDWNQPGYLFSERTGSVPSQPPLVLP